MHNGPVPATADAVVIGGGVMGVSTACDLARRGCGRVVVLERDPLIAGHSTSRCTGGVRQQFSTRTNIELSLLSLGLLEELAAEIDEPVELRRCGYLFALTENDNLDSFARAVALQRELGVQTEWLSGAEVRARLPELRLDDVVAGTYCADEGHIDPSAVVNAYAKLAKRHGALLFPATAAQGIRIEGGKICSVKTSDAEIATSTVVDAAGPWATCVARMAGVEIPIRPEPQQVFVTSELPALSDEFPIAILPGEGLGLQREGQGILTGLRREHGEASDQELEHGMIAVDRLWEARHRELAIERLPELERARIVARWSGLYEITPDGHPVLGRVPDVDGLFVIGGFCGHGFMHAAASGRLLSEEILDGAAHSLDIGALRVMRFSGAEHPLESYMM